MKIGIHECGRKWFVLMGASEASAKSFWQLPLQSTPLRSSPTIWPCLRRKTWSRGMPHQEGRQGCYRSASGTKALSYSGPSGVATGAAYSYERSEMFGLRSRTQCGKVITSWSTVSRHDTVRIPGRALQSPPGCWDHRWGEQVHPGPLWHWFPKSAQRPGDAQMHKTWQETTLGSAHPARQGYAATDKSSTHVIVEAGTTLCQHKQADGKAKHLVNPYTTTDVYEALAWERPWCDQCLRRAPASWWPPAYRPDPAEFLAIAPFLACMGRSG